MGSYYAVAPYSAELYHHGVKGQKWGVRRFQNADGSLTAAGKKRAARDAKQGIERNKEGEWRRTKTKGGHLDRSINASKKTRLANGKRLVEEGETVGSRLMKRVGTQALHTISGRAMAVGGMAATVALTATGSLPLVALGYGLTVGAAGYNTYRGVRNVVGAYQDIADISAYNQSRR